MNKAKNRAFTVVEILIVLAIICLLAAVTIPTFVQSLKNKREREEKAAQPAAAAVTNALVDVTGEAGAGTEP
jgi:prepilin-type N-terminal cleavage/methylation domain-containing protein